MSSDSILNVAHFVPRGSQTRERALYTLYSPKRVAAVFPRYINHDPKNNENESM